MKSENPERPGITSRRSIGRVLLTLTGLLLLVFLILHSAADSSAAGEGTTKCRLTHGDSLGPFYKPGAPERTKVGEGYVLKGSVKSAGDCSPLADARIEFWLAGPDKQYDDARRATVYSGAQGGYSFESNFPPPYMSRPSHIHVKVTAPGYKELVTQHYPRAGEKESNFDLILEPQSATVAGGGAAG